MILSVEASIATALLLSLLAKAKAEANPNGPNSIISQIVYDKEDTVTASDEGRIRTGGIASPPISIPDTGTRGDLEVTLNVQNDELENCIIDDINVEIEMEHSWSSDCDITLCNPVGTCVELFTDIGGSTALDSRKTIILDDEATQNIRDSISDSNPFGTPENGSLSDFDGEAALGVWTLEIVDDAVIGTGLFYSLFFDIACTVGGETPDPSQSPAGSDTTQSPVSSSPTSNPTTQPTESPTAQPTAAPVELPGPQPAWSLISNTGSPSQCLILDDRPNCIKSSEAPPYETGVFCVFEALEDGELSVEFWDVEEQYDGFYLNVERTLRDTKDQVDGLVLSRGDTLTWLSDRLTGLEGWLICLAGPTESPTLSPTQSPSLSPTVSPTPSPTLSPTKSPSQSPTVSPTKAPSQNPTTSPTGAPTEEVVLTTAVCPLCFMPVPMTWIKAQSTAQEYSCALASIETIDDVLQASLDFSSHMIDEKYWVGGYQSDSDLLWYWADGAPFSGNRWAPGEPNGISEEGVGGLTNYTAIGGHETGGGLISLFDESGEADLRSIWKCCGGCPSLDTSLLFNRN